MSLFHIGRRRFQTGLRTYSTLKRELALSPRLQKSSQTHVPSILIVE